LELKNRIEREFANDEWGFNLWPINYDTHFKTCQILASLRLYALNTYILIFKYVPWKKGLYKARVNAIFNDLPPLAAGFLKLECQSPQTEKQAMDVLLREEKKQIDVFKNVTYKGQSL
jgi:hypothetical protein